MHDPRWRQLQPVLVAATVLWNSCQIIDGRRCSEILDDGPGSEACLINIVIGFCHHLALVFGCLLLCQIPSVHRQRVKMIWGAE